MVSRYIIGTLSALLILSVMYSNSLKHDIDMLTVELELSKNNVVSLTSAIDRQNKEIAKYELDLKTKTEEYNNLATKPVEVRYETVYKKIPSIKVKSDECKDIKKLLDDIRNTGY